MTKLVAFLIGKWTIRGGEVRISRGLKKLRYFIKKREWRLLFCLNLVKPTSLDQQMRNVYNKITILPWDSTRFLTQEPDRAIKKIFDREKWEESGVSCSGVAKIGK